jgi:Flp pilus assembly protein TadG
MMFRPSHLKTSPRTHSPLRRGAAAVEFAVVMTFVLVPFMCGVWEVGRLVQVQQIVSNSAREGARLAAQGRTINATGSPTQIVTSINPGSNPTFLPNIKAAVYQSLYGAGLTNLRWNDITVTFTYTSSPTGAMPGATEPVDGVKDQRFTVRVSINYDNKVRWVNFGIVTATTVAFTAEWRILVDDPFQVNDTMPTW